MTLDELRRAVDDRVRMNDLERRIEVLADKLLRAESVTQVEQSALTLAARAASESPNSRRQWTSPNREGSSSGRSAERRGSSRPAAQSWRSRSAS